MDDAERRRRLAALTAEQRAIMRLLCVPTPRKEISELRNMTIAGVDYHCDQIAHKLGLADAAKRRNAVAFRLGLLAFLPALLALEEGDVPPSPAPAEEPPPEDAPAPDPALLATIDAMAALARRSPDALVPWPADAAGAPARPNPTARQALGRWWRPLAFFLVVALAAGMAGGVTAARLLGGNAGPAPALAALATAESPTAVPPAPTARTSGTASAAVSTPTTAAVANAALVAPAPSKSASSSASPAGPTPAPTVVVGVDPAAPPRDLAGTVASDLPGTPLALGRAVTSVIDDHSKRRDVYALQLPAGERFHLAVQASSPDFAATFGPAGALPLGLRGATLCSDLDVAKTCTASLPIAASGGYLLLIEATGPGVRYTLQPATLPLAAPAGATFLAGRAASNVPGTPLALGHPVFSVVDQDAKPADAYALRLRTGQTLRVQLSATPSEAVVRLLPPGAAPFTGAPSAAGGTTLCNGPFQFGPCDQTFPIAQGGDYTLLVEADAPGMQYTLQATAQ